MNIVRCTLALAVATSLTCCAVPKLSDAKLTKAQALKIALTKAPKGHAKESELEVEHGRLVWSFDLATPGKVNITEVQVDARDGTIVSVEEETPEQTAKEAAEDRKKKAGKR